jgi:hypothetical protein
MQITKAYVLSQCFLPPALKCAQEAKSFSNCPLMRSIGGLK